MCSAVAISATKMEQSRQVGEELLPPTTGLEGHTVTELPSMDVPALSDEEIS